MLRLLNRLIFIRTAEDREVEPLRLMPLLRELEAKHQMDKLSVKLVELFRQFDATYNSELFAPHFSEDLYCDRMPLEALIRGLYEKNFVRYNFNALEADVLGTANEQYLGTSSPKRVRRRHALPKCVAQCKQGDALRRPYHPTWRKSAPSARARGSITRRPS